MNFDEYKNVLPYPQKSDFKTTYYYNRGRRLGVLPVGADSVILDPGISQEDWDNSNGYRVVEKVYEKEAYYEKRDAYNAEEKRIDEKFKKDLLEEIGMTGHSKADKVFEMAWDKGHAEGLRAVFYEAERLAELFV